MAEDKSVFNSLNSIDVSEKDKEKNGFTYLSWASAWGEIKKRYPEATYKIYPQVMDDKGNTRFWHDDGKTGWTEVGVTINGLEIVEVLPIMDYRNVAIPVEKITSYEANKSMKRCLVKACALHGLGLYIYEGEDLPEELSKLVNIQKEVAALAKKRSSLSEKAKEKAISLCKAAEKESNPNMDGGLITGKVSNIDDVTILETLKKDLLAVRK